MSDNSKEIPRIADVANGMQDDSFRQEIVSDEAPDNVIMFPTSRAKEEVATVPEPLVPYSAETAQFLSPGKDGDSLYNQIPDRRKPTTKGMPRIVRKPVDEFVEQDPAGEVTRPDPNDVRDAISSKDGERALVKHDIGKMADSVMRVAGIVKHVAAPKVERTRTHGQKPKKAPKPLEKDRAPQYKTPDAIPGTSQSDPNLWSNVPRSGILK